MMPNARRIDVFSLNGSWFEQFVSIVKFYIRVIPCWFGRRLWGGKCAASAVADPPRLESGQPMGEEQGMMGGRAG